MGITCIMVWPNLVSPINSFCSCWEPHENFCQPIFTIYIPFSLFTHSMFFLFVENTPLTYLCECSVFGEYPLTYLCEWSLFGGDSPWHTNICLMSANERRNSPDGLRWGTDVFCNNTVHPCFQTCKHCYSFAFWIDFWISVEIAGGGGGGGLALIIMLIYIGILRVWGLAPIIMLIY